MSFGIIADKEKDLKDFALLCKKRGASVSSHEDAFTWLPENPTSLLVAMWRDARSKGAAKIGAAISATNKKEKTAACIARIKDKWPLSSSEWPTAALLEEAGVSLNTAKAHLGRRPIAQHYYQAAQKRKEHRNQRMAWIDEMLCVYGFINREHICRKFDVSTPQASLDLKRFMENNKEWVSYNQSTKRYEALNG